MQRFHRRRRGIGHRGRAHGDHHPEDRRSDRGAALLEFAILAPLLFLLLFGMIDAGWAFFQNLEVRHGAREAARLAVVDFGDEATIAAETCARMTATGDTSVQVFLTRTGDAIGDKVTATVVRNHSALVAFIPFFDGIWLRTDVEMRLEQPPSWTPTAAPSATPPYSGGISC